MLSKLVIAFLPRSKCPLNSWLQSPSAVILESKEIKSVTVSNKAEVDAFLELSGFFYGPKYVGSLTSVSSAFSKSRLKIWKFSVHENFMNCWSLAWRILSITMLVCEMSQLCSSLNILWHCPSLGWEWKLTFSSPVATAEFSKFAGILSAPLSQHPLLGFEIAQLEFHHLH